MNTEHAQLESRSKRPWPQGGMQNQPTPMRVSLAYVEHRVNLYLRFGQPVNERVLDRWRRVATFAPGAVCCRVKWLSEAYYRALLFTGKVVMLTGVTLAIGVITWVFSPIKFQADMGLLLAFMFLWNMLGALVLIPSLACFLLIRPQKV